MNIKQIVVKMKRIIYCIFLSVFLISCKGKAKTSASYSVRSDIRFGTKFFSIYISEEGNACVVKGKGSLYTDSLNVSSADKSDVFKLDSVNIFFDRLNRIKDKPIIGERRLDAPRVEIFYNEQKIYDAYYWDEIFWDLFRPIMKQIPAGFNPFLADEKPFG